MTRWYRAYAGTVSDAKLGEAALVAECSRALCVAVWHAILEDAAETNDAGRFETTARRVAAILAEPVKVIESVLGAFDEIGLTTGNVISAWRKRQYESDNSTERSRQHRERQRNGDATLQQRHATPPETETETETETEAEKKVRARSPSGSRLAPDWQPSSDLVAFASGEGFSPDEITRTAEQFRDYWHSVAGSKGRKADWAATWRGWIRRDLDRRAGNGGRQRQSTGEQRFADFMSAAAASAGRERGTGAVRSDPEGSAGNDYGGATVVALAAARG